jgi:hypothetical protein
MDIPALILTHESPAFVLRFSPDTSAHRYTTDELLGLTAAWQKKPPPPKPAGVQAGPDAPHPADAANATATATAAVLMRRLTTW